jgi:hypothetical protein
MIKCSFFTLLKGLAVRFTILNIKDKTVYDCVEMRDGELMINSGVCN